MSDPNGNLWRVFSPLSFRDCSHYANAYSDCEQTSASWQLVKAGHGISKFIVLVHELFLQYAYLNGWI